MAGVFICNKDGDVYKRKPRQRSRKSHLTNYFKTEKSIKRRKRYSMKQKFSETENLKTKFPLNLQFFAEGDDPEPETTPNAGDEPEGGDEPSLSAEEQMQQLMLENAKLKKSFDRASSEAADFKKKYNATLSDAQKASQEKAEKEAERDELLKNLTRENSVNKLAKNFLTLGYAADMAEKAAAAQDRKSVV